MPFETQPEPPPALQRALALLNQQLGTNLMLADLSAWRSLEKVYNDASLGCPQSQRRYAQVITRGYQFLLTYQGITYDFRSNQHGSNVFLCRNFPAADGGDNERALL
ncbi:MAG TPA: hypothetical protein VHO69_10940 [Phototrophicaceae bacterium]|nr:hypothetical protein [Phototrophicaceae bacterium]